MTPRVLSGIAVILLAGTTSPKKTLATSETTVEVAQPIAVEEGLFVSTVTYVRHADSSIPGGSVGLVSEPNCVLDDLGKSVNRNAASHAGIKTGSDYNPSTGLFGDTLAVWVDVSAMPDTSVINGWSTKATVAATVECVLLTAWWTRFGWDPATRKAVEAQYVRLEVRGSQSYASLAGVFSFAALGKLPRRSHFH